MIHSKVEDAEIEHGSVSLIVSSPPYGIGKEYEIAKTLEEYVAWAEGTVRLISDFVKPGGVVCWQVGNYIEKGGDIVPLDEVYSPIFRKNGFGLRNRIVWRVGHGLHGTKKLSGRYEVLLVFAKKGGEPTFNLDEVRTPAKEPGKRAYKGPKRGELSGNPLGTNPSDVWDLIESEWDTGIMEIPPVKNNHVEKSAHPCQFPVELVERCVLLYSNPGDVVFDPFAGTGSTLVAAVFHDRVPRGCECDENYVQIANERIEKARKGELNTRHVGTAIVEASMNTKTRQYPDEWKGALEEASKKKRLVESPLQRYAKGVLRGEHVPMDDPEELYRAMNHIYE